MPANFFLRYKLHHLAGWLLLFAFWYFLRYEDYRVPGRAFLITLIKVIDLAILIYTTNYLFIPQLFYKKRYGWFALAFILLVVVSSTIKMNILGRIMDRPDLYSLSGDLKRKIYDNMIPHFFLGIAGAAIKVMIDYTRLQKRLAEIATEKAAAELKFLKSQINPHFLFNSLNSVYFLIDRNNTVARESLHKFSDMLRYQLYEMNGERIPVEREISYLQDYVSLQQLRKDEKYTVSFECAPGVSNFSLEPLLLIPFVENAFKHVSSHVDKLNFVKIALARNDGEFVFTTENSTGPDKATDPHSGIGLTNVRRRLELLYPGKFDLDVRDNNGIYKVKLTLKINA